MSFDEAMDRDSDRCALELSDAKVDVLGYACLVAIMSMGLGVATTWQMLRRLKLRAQGAWLRRVAVRTLLTGIPPAA